MTQNISEIDYSKVLEYSLDPIIIHSDLRILYINTAAEKFFRGTKEASLELSPLDIFYETSKAAIEKRIHSAYEKPAEVIEETIFRMDGTTVEVELYCHPVLIGNTKAIQTVVRDISEKKEMMRRQHESVVSINELSATPVPIIDGVAVLALVGSIDEDRAKHLLDSVPFKVKKLNIQYLIIDFTGTYELNSTVTDYLFRINRVLSMLGIQSIITGLRPELALIAMELDLNLDSIDIKSTVKDAVRTLV